MVDSKPSVDETFNERQRQKLSGEQQIEGRCAGQMTKDGGEIEPGQLQRDESKRGGQPL